MGKFVRQLLPFASLILIICTLSALKPDTFLTMENFMNVLRRSSVNGIIAIGMTSIIISAGIDLSVGSMLALCGMVGAFMMSKGSLSMVFPQLAIGRISVALVATSCGLFLIEVQKHLREWKFSPFFTALLALFLVVAADIAMIGWTMGFYPFIISAIVGIGAAVILGFLGRALLEGFKLSDVMSARVLLLFMVVSYMILIRKGIALLMPNPLVFGTIVGVAAGICCGLLNGALITKLKLQPFIVTLGTMSAFRGISYVMNSGQPYNVPGYKYLGEGIVLLWKTVEKTVNTIENTTTREVLKIMPPWGAIDSSMTGEGIEIVKHGIPISIIIFVVIIAIAGFLLKYSRLGRYTYAIGSNREAAFHAGVNVDRNLIYIYTFTGLLVGIAAMIATSRTVSAQPTAGIALELDIIAAVVIGGASLAGGRGTITGTIIGTLLISVLRNGCTLLGISTHIQLIVIGMIIILAVAVDQLAQTKTRELQA